MKRNFLFFFTEKPLKMIMLGFSSGLPILTKDQIIRNMVARNTSKEDIKIQKPMLESLVMVMERWI